MGDLEMRVDELRQFDAKLLLRTMDTPVGQVAHRLLITYRPSPINVPPTFAYYTLAPTPLLNTLSPIPLFNTLSPSPINSLSPIA